MNESLVGRNNAAASNSGTVTVLGGLLALSLAALIAVSIALPLTLGRVATQQCGGVSIRADQLCVDFIVGGGGTAGTAAAKRISDDFTQTVLVVEAGGDIINDPIVFESLNVLESLDVPYSYPYAYNHGFLTKQQAAQDFRQISMIGGRGLGGSTLINTYLSVTGSAEYWDAVDTYLGSPGTFNADAIYSTNADLEWLETYQHYAAGPDRGTQESATNQYKLASKPVINDANDDNHFVASLIASAYGIPDGNGTQSYNNKDVNFQANPFIEMLQNFNESSFPRWGARRAFLNPTVMDQTTYAGIGGRQLQVLLNSTIMELLWNPYNPTHCIGVRYVDSQGASHDVFARKEVIQTMWWNNVALLQRAGVGPASVLSDAGVAPRVINENIGTQWKTHPLVSIAFLSSNVTGAPTDPPNTGSAPGLTIAFVDDTSPSGLPGRRGYEYISATFPSVLGLFFWQLDSVGVGSVAINSGDPTQPPKFTVSSLKEPEDLESMRIFIRRAVTEMTTADPDLLLLSIDPITLADDTLLDEWLAANADLGLYHHFGLVPMGPDVTTGAVDTRFRVYGTTGLRVCDSSVLPIPSDGNPSTPAYILGDICGRMILEDNGLLTTTPSAKTHVFETRKQSGPTHKSKTSVRRDVPKQAPFVHTSRNHDPSHICTVVGTMYTQAFQRLSKSQAETMMRPICLNYPGCCV